jgi:hypothetical protein
MPPRTPYCGAKEPAPRGRVVGTPNYCYRTGLKSGFAAAASTRLTHAQIGEMINTRGIGWLKDHLHLNDLKKDEVRACLTRLTGTAQAVPGYSHMSLAQMKEALVQRGFHL